MKEKDLRKIYKICLSVVTLALAAQFLVQVWLLYLHGGEHPYTTETVAAHFMRIRGGGIWLLLALVGAFVFPDEREKVKASPNADKTLRGLQRRLPSDRKMEEMQRLHRFQYGICVVCTILCAFVSVVIAVLMYNDGYQATLGATFFKTHTEAEKLIWVSLLAIGALGFCTAAAYVRERTLYREIALVKTEIAQAAKEGNMVKSASKTPTKREVFVQKYPFLQWVGTRKGVLVSRIVVAAVGVVFVIAGVCNGGMADVLEKAVQICTQCIGLG